MIFVIIITHAAHKSQHNFRFFRPAAADERLPLTRELSAKLTEGETLHSQINIFAYTTKIAVNIQIANSHYR